MGTDSVGQSGHPDPIIDLLQERLSWPAAGSLPHWQSCWNSAYLHSANLIAFLEQIAKMDPCRPSSSSSNQSNSLNDEWYWAKNTLCYLWMLARVASFEMKWGIDTEYRVTWGYLWSDKCDVAMQRQHFPMLFSYIALLFNTIYEYNKGNSEL